MYPAGSNIPLTSFSREVLSALPDTNVPGNTNNYSTLQAFTADSNKAGGKIDIQATPMLSMFGRYGFRNLTTDDQPNIPLPSGGARQRPHLRAQPAARARRDLGAEHDVAARSAIRLLLDAGGQESAGARHAERVRRVRPARPARRRAHRRRPADASHHRILGPRTPGHEPAVAVPDGLQPEDQLHVDDEVALVQERVRVPEDRHRGAGRQPALRPRHVQRPVQPSGRSRVEQPLQPRRLHARPARAVRAQQRARRRPPARHALRLPPGRLARREEPDGQSRPALRVLDALLGSRTTSCPISIRRPTR